MARTFYVAISGGNDANTPTQAQNIATPKQHLQNVIDTCALAAGDTVYLRGGQYDENIVISGLAGAPGNEILISGYPSETVIIATPIGGGNAVFIASTSYIEFRDFIVDAYYAAAIDGFNATTGDIHHMTYRRLQIKNAGRGSGGYGDAVYVGYTNGMTGGGRASLFDDCDFFNNGNGGYDHGLYGPGAGPGTVINNCRFYHNSGHGLHDYNSTSGDFSIDVINCSAWANGQSGFVAGLSRGGSGLAVYGSLTGARFVNCLSYKNFEAGIKIQYGNAAAQFYNCTAFGNVQEGIAAQVDGVFVGSTIRNCIAFGNGSANILTGGSDTADHNLTSDPLFVDSAGDDYHLQSGSAARDAGLDVGVTLDLDGALRDSPPDLGCYEFAGGSPPPITGVPPTDGLDYASGNINGKNSGTDWLTAWQDEGTTVVTIETEPAGAQGGSAAKLVPASSTTCRASRQFSPTNDGTFYFILRSSSASPSATQGVFLRSGGLFAAVDAGAVRLGPSGNIQALDNGIYSTIGSYVADTWYEIAVQFDKTGQPGKYRVIIDGGTPSSWLGLNGSTSVDVVMLYNANPGITFWVSAIGFHMPTTTSAGTISQLILKKVLKDEDFDLGAVAVSLHTGPTGLFGANEVTGGGYTQQPAGTWNAASNAEISNQSEILWASGFPLTTVTDQGLHSGDGLFISGRALDKPVTVTNGKARFAAGNLKFAVSNKFSTYLANKLLDYMLSGVNFTTAPVWASIHVGTLDESGGGEVSGGTYARQELDIANWADNGMSLFGDTLFQLLYNADVSWESLPAGAQARIGFYDGPDPGDNFLMWGPDLTLPADEVTAVSGQLSATITQTP